MTEQSTSAMVIYRGEGRNIRFDPAGAGLGQWWSSDPTIAERFGLLRTAVIRPDAQLLILHDSDGTANRTGYDQLSALLDTPLDQWLNDDGESLLCLFRDSVRSIKEAGFDIIRTKNIEGPADYVLSDVALDEITPHEVAIPQTHAADDAR